MTSYPTPKLILDKALSATLLIVLAGVRLPLRCDGAGRALPRARSRTVALPRRRIWHGREFDLLKFRTLRREVVDRIDPAKSHARLHEADESNLTWARRRLLKPRYLDELPQIWNVFRGDMRPRRPATVAAVDGCEPGG